MTDNPEEILTPTPDSAAVYDESSITTLDWKEHIRLRPGMYIGDVGDGSKFDDGIYVLIKEVVDNAIDEFVMGYGKSVVVDVTETSVQVRDYGRGIPLGKLVEASSSINTGGKYGSKAFKKSVGLNGVGIKAVNALSTEFYIRSVRDGQAKSVLYSRGEILEESEIEMTDEPNGTLVRFTPDDTIFKGYTFHMEFVIPMVKNYTYLNTGLSFLLNGKKYVSKGGLLDLLRDNITTDKTLYEPIHLVGEDIEVAITHADQRGEEYYSFVNGANTIHGGTHLAAFKEAVARTFKDYFKKDFDPSDVRGGIIAAISVKVEEPVFDSQAKTKLTSREISDDGPSVQKFIGDFLRTELDNYLHRNTDIADIILEKVQKNERDRKAMTAVTKANREKAKKINLHNKKLLDCRVHLNDAKGDEEKKRASSIFITEGDSAAGSITKIRNVETQAVFSLRGKPKNSYGVPAKILYENEEFNLLQAALNIEEGIDGLRYNNVIIATDADVDGMHIRLLLLTFFLQFFPEMVKRGHVYVLQTPLFRVRNSKTARKGARSKSSENTETYYCYTDEERIEAIRKLGDNAEITRFKGLGEISPDEFRGFIGPDMRADRVSLRKEDTVDELLEFYMGKNTMDRQVFIINNLVVEDDSHLDSEIPLDADE
ncbi:MAG: toprim domain-containing protein [Muribaculaceae bacterium]|nr:toprim domain-containing protein [Muribaculaceae bacterium]